MNIQDIKDKACVSAMLKIKRLMRVVRRPFVRIRADQSLDLYANESCGDPIMSSSKKIDSDVKLFDLACILAAVCAFFSFVKALCRLFD